MLKLPFRRRADSGSDKTWLLEAWTLKALARSSTMTCRTRDNFSRTGSDGPDAWAVPGRRSRSSRRTKSGNGVRSSGAWAAGSSASYGVTARKAEPRRERLQP